MTVTFATAQQENPPVEPMDQTPVFRVNVVSRTTKAVNYRHRGGSTTVDIKGTEPDAGSDRQSQSGQQSGRLQINVELSKLGPATADRSAVPDLCAVGDHAGRAGPEPGARSFPTNMERAAWT